MPAEMMRIAFELPASTAELLTNAARRMQLVTGEEQTPSEICKALVHEVLIDDAAEHGYVPNSIRPH